MKYRRFGKTELDMPVISCGGMRYQQSWADGDPVSDENHLCGIDHTQGTGSRYADGSSGGLAVIVSCQAQLDLKFDLYFSGSVHISVRTSGLLSC